MTRRFWWKPKEKEGRFIAWKQWDKLCRPKAAGGLGFKKTEEVNVALLAKLAWMVASGKHSICMEVLRNKYKVKEDWLRANPKKIASPTWRGIEEAKKLIVKEACYLLGDGNSISVWEDPWVPWIEGFKPRLKVEVYSQLHFKAHHFVDSTSKSWDVNMIKEIFDSDSAVAILTIPIPSTPRQDKMIWLPNPKGNFSVKSVHKMAFHNVNNNDQAQSHWKYLWKAKLLERLKMLLWRIGANAMPNKVKL